MPILILVVLLLILFVLAPWLMAVFSAIAAMVGIPVLIGASLIVVGGAAWLLWKILSESFKSVPSDPAMGLIHKLCTHCRRSIPSTEHHCSHCGKLTK